MRCPRSDRYSPLPGSFGHHVDRHYDRSGRCFPGLGQAGAGNARGRTRGLRPPVGAPVQGRTSCRVPGNLAWSCARGPRGPTVRTAVERRQASVPPPLPSPARGGGKRDQGARRIRKMRRLGNTFVGVPPPFICGELCRVVLSGAKPTRTVTSEKRGVGAALCAFAHPTDVAFTKLGRICVARTSLFVHLSPLRGERSSERSEARVRGPLRNSERCNSEPGGNAPSPHPLPARGEREFAPSPLVSAVPFPDD